ncbi:MAG: TIM barrel protein [Alsobacter sp.]
MRLDPNRLPGLGVAHFTAIDDEPLAFVTMAAESGFSAVGLRLHPAFPGAPFYEIPTGSSLMRDMRRRLADTGLRVYDIEFVTVTAGFDPASIAAMLDSAADLGASRISTCGDGADRDGLVQAFEALCDAAAERSLAVDLEVMPWRSVGSLADALDVLDRAGRPNAGLLVDALHLSRSAASPADLARCDPRLIRSVQLCDAVKSRPATKEDLIKEARGGRLLPGAGALPLHELIAVAPDEAALSVEVPKVNSPAQEHLNAAFEGAQRVLRASDSAENRGNLA